jgi:hypothetical protein
MADGREKGTILQILTFPWPWPCPTRTLIVRREPATIFAEPNGSLLAQIVADNQTFEFQSCPLLFPDGKTSTNLGLSWDLPRTVNMIVGQTIVLSTGQPDLVPSEARIRSGLPNDTRNFLKENDDALRKRNDTLPGSKADKRKIPGRRDATPNELFDALLKAQQEIADLIVLVEQGRIQHVNGLLRLLRLTITDKKDKPLPLLQHCAAMVGSQIIVFAPPINASRVPLPMTGVETIAFPISASATDLLKNAVDLDVWLESRAAQLNGRVLNQRELINNVANSIATHLDVQVRPEIDALRSWKSGIGGVDLDFIVHYVIAVSTAVRDIIPPILAAERT